MTTHRDQFYDRMARCIAVTVHELEDTLDTLPPWSTRQRREVARDLENFIYRWMSNMDELHTTPIGPEGEEEPAPDPIDGPPEGHA